MGDESELGPDKFGNYSYILTIATLFFIVQDGGFRTLLFRENTLPSKGLERYGDRLFSWALGHAVVITAAGAFFVLVFPTGYRIEILAAIFCFGFQAVVNFISSELRAKGLFPREALWQATVRTFAAAGIFVAILFVRPVPWVIFACWSFGLLLCLFLSPRRIARPLFGSFRIRDIRKACFGFMAIEAATTVYYRCDIILLERLVGDPALVGYYAAAYRFLDGIILLAAPLGIIWFRKLRLVSEEEMAFQVQIGWMSMIMLVAAVLIIAVGVPFSREIVVLTFGHEYVDSARLLPWLLGALIFILPNGVLTQAAIARNREIVYAVAAGGGAVVNIGLNLVLIPRFGAIGAAWATIVTEAFLTIALIFGLRKIQEK